MKLVAVTVFALCAATLVGQEIQPPPTMAYLMPYSYSSGAYANLGSTAATMHTYDIIWPLATSLRVLFSNVAIGSEDYVRVSDPVSGDEHRLNSIELQKWESTSGYFNGDRVRLDLVLMPGSSGSFTVGSLLVGLEPSGADTICGVDDRIASTDYKSMRFSSLVNGQAASAGCTIWLAGGNDCALSAGHCFSGGTLLVAETMCPPSTAGGAVVHPPIQFQFTVQPATITFVNGGQGNDYGVCRLNPNNLNQTANSLFGAFQLGFFIPPVSNPIRITGYGTDSGVQNQTLQTHVGPAAAAVGFSLRYVTDTTGGNSGSPVIDETSGMAIGIHTHGGCTATAGANSGTSTTLAGFVSAYNALCPPPLPSFNIDATSTGGGVGDFHLQVNNIPANAVEGFTLISFNTSLAVGQGALVGLNPDLTTIACLSSPASVGNLLHWTLPAPSFFPNVPFDLPPAALPFPPGFRADVRVIAFAPGTTSVAMTNLVRVQF